MSGIDPKSIVTLPPADKINLKYIAEGAANIIYRISFPHSAAVPENFPKNHLLRLRKALPSASSSLSTFTALQSVFLPLFPKEYILDTRLIKISRDLVDEQNKELKEMEAEERRASGRAGLYLVGPRETTEGQDYEAYGFLVEDMSPINSTVEITSSRQVLVEFKPKWLLQSPSAPANAQRCRSCALRISRDFEKNKRVTQGNGTGTEEEINRGNWCPLDLASGESERIRRAVRGILATNGAVWTGWGGKEKKLTDEDKGQLEQRVYGYFNSKQGREFIGLLKKLQGGLDPKGPVKLFGAEGGRLDNSAAAKGKSYEGNNEAKFQWSTQWTEEVRNFLIAMTVRDLTLFVKVDLSIIPSNSPSEIDSLEPPITLRIGDLDLKSPSDGKAAYWVGVEKKLIENGWYTGTEGGMEKPVVELPQKVAEPLREYENARWCLP